MENSIGQPTLSEVQIIDYESQYCDDFFELNKRWIEKDFLLEQTDIDALSNPEEYILAPGGAVLLAKLDNKIVGTCALKKTSDAVYELTKMSVDEDYRGKKIGETLGRATLVKAKQLGATKVELYSNRHTSAIAVKLYYKLGFVEVPLNPGVYKRANIKMEIEV
jgi:N-acetylglutamate synthase-like GNAT family acetyltransferase